MPIHLKVPAHRAGGPDGQGWNRISLGSLAGDQCALRPRDYSHLLESQDTRRASYGGYGPCIADGDCQSCPILSATPRHMDAFDNRVLVRIHPVQRDPYLMNHAEKGWSSVAWRWTWQELARLDGWTVGRAYQDEHGDGFWIERASATP